MKRPSTFVVVALSLFALTVSTWAATRDQEPNTLTDEEKQAGFKLLFDGKTTEGWRGFRKPELPKSFAVTEGTLSRVAGGGDIITTDQFGNFELRLQWKVSPGANSGIMYHVSEEELAPYATGPEYQVLDNAKHADGKNPKTSAASCYALYAPTKDVCRPVGEWNDTVIIIKDGKVEHWLNGEKVVEFDKNSDAWKELVAGSKFKTMKKFGTTSKGHICLQDHGDPVSFRNIRIKVLD